MKSSFRLLSSLFSIIVFSALVSSCNQSSTPGDVQPGSITGKVQLVDNAGNWQASSAGVTIVLDKSNYSTQTDSAGRWEIDNVTPGNYDIVVSKPGFGLCRAYGVPIAGPGMSNIEPMTIGIAPTVAPVLSNVAVTSTKEDSAGTTMLSLTGEFSGGTYGPSPIFFIDLNPNVQPGDSHTLWYTASEIGSSTQFAFSVAMLHAAGIPSGTIVYISASQANFYSVWQGHSAGPISSGTYNDPYDNSTRLISPGPRSNVVAVTVP